MWTLPLGRRHQARRSVSLPRSNGDYNIRGYRYPLARTLCHRHCGERMSRLFQLASILSLLLAGSQRQLLGQPAWSHFTLSATGPNLNGNPPVYDPISNQFILFGGFASGPCCFGLSETWLLTNPNAA